MGNKKVSMQYFTIEAAEDYYFDKIHDQFMASKGDFDAGEIKYTYEVLEQMEFNGAQAYMISIAKEPELWPHMITDDGEHTELALPKGKLGDMAYCLVCPAYRFIITYGSPSIFKKLFGQFSVEGIVRLNPYFEDNIYEKVLLWDNFRKVTYKLNYPSSEELEIDRNETISDPHGYFMVRQSEKALKHIGGLKGTMTLSAANRESLSAAIVRALIERLLPDEFCTSLIIQGSDFENAATEQYDLKNAQIKYHENIKFEGNYIMETDIKQAFMRAVNERASMLFAEVQ